MLCAPRSAPTIPVPVHPLSILPVSFLPPTLLLDHPLARSSLSLLDRSPVHARLPSVGLLPSSGWVLLGPERRPCWTLWAGGGDKASQQTVGVGRLSGSRERGQPRAGEGYWVLPPGRWQPFALVRHGVTHLPCLCFLCGPGPWLHPLGFSFPLSRMGIVRACASRLSGGPHAMVCRVGSSALAFFFPGVAQRPWGRRRSPRAPSGCRTCRGPVCSLSMVCRSGGTAVSTKGSSVWTRSWDMASSPGQLAR